MIILPILTIPHVQLHFSWKGWENFLLSQRVSVNFMMQRVKLDENYWLPTSPSASSPPHQHYYHCRFNDHHHYHLCDIIPSSPSIATSYPDSDIYFFVWILLTFPPSALKCRVYDAPLNGARACNIKTDGIEQELACTVMCNEKAGFVPPPQWDSYLCQSDGHWYGLKQNTFVPLRLPQGKPWPDCGRKWCVLTSLSMFTAHAHWCFAVLTFYQEIV